MPVLHHVFMSGMALIFIERLPVTCSERGDPLLTPKAASVRGFPSQGARIMGMVLYSSCRGNVLGNASVHW